MTPKEDILDLLSRHSKMIINPDTPFIELGVESIVIMTMVSHIRRTYGVKLTPDIIQKHNTISSLSTYIDTHSNKNVLDT
jgi:acyl carrier protein